MSGSRVILIAIACLVVFMSKSFGDQPIPIAVIQRELAVDYEKEIAPFLRANCVSCHNKTTTKGELNIESVELMLIGGESGPSIIVGKGSESMLVRSAAHIDDPAMPPRENKVKANNLTSQQLGLLQLWIDQGAIAKLREEREIKWEPIPESVKCIYATAITRDGQVAGFSRGGQILLYHIPTRRFMTRLFDATLVSSGLVGNQSGAHQDMIPSLAFSPDGTRLASGSHREIKIWQRIDQIETLELSAEPSRSEKQAEPNATTIVSPNGKCSATIETDSITKLVNKETGALIADLRGEHAANVAAAESARRVDFLASESDYRSKEVKRIEEDVKRLGERAKKIGEELLQAEKVLEPKKEALQVAVDASRVARKAVRGLYRKLRPRGSNHMVPDEQLRKTRDVAETELATLSKSVKDAESEIEPLRQAIVQHQSELKLANEHVAKKVLAVEEAKVFLASAESLQQAAIREAANARDIAKAHERVPTAMAFSPDSTQIVTATEDGILHVWSAIDGTSMKTINANDSKAKRIKSMEWNDQGIVATAEDGNRVSHRIVEKWRLERTMGGLSSPIHDRVTALCFSSDGTLLAAGSGPFSRSGELTVWRTSDGSLVKALPELHKDSILSICFSRDDRRLATGSSDKTMKVVNTENWQTEKSFEGHTNHVLSVAWRAEGRTLASAGADNVLKIWDFESGDRTRNMEGWDDEVTSVQFVGLTGNLLVSSGDKRVRILSETGAEVRSFAGCKDYMQSAAACADGHHVVAGGHDGVLYVWDGESGKLISEFVESM